MFDNKNELKVITTEDSSFTLFNPLLNETYHSIHGALQESMHVFIQNGLQIANKKLLNILEIGLGTGLNAALTGIQAELNNYTINYTGLEPFPVPQIVLEKVSQGYQENIRKLMLKIGSLDWEKSLNLNNNFSLTKHLIELQTFNTLLKYDIIYYDAFAPNKQPDMWTPQILLKTASLLKEGGVLCTYCAKGEVKRNLKQAGLHVEARKGPVGKREMTIAFKPMN